jgi:hypothetical protein
MRSDIHSFLMIFALAIFLCTGCMAFRGRVALEDRLGRPISVAVDEGYWCKDEDRISLFLYIHSPAPQLLPVPGIDEYIFMSQVSEIMDSAVCFREADLTAWASYSHLWGECKLGCVTLDHLSLRANRIRRCGLTVEGVASGNFVSMDRPEKVTHNAYEFRGIRLKQCESMDALLGKALRTRGITPGRRKRQEWANRDFRIRIGRILSQSGQKHSEPPG